MSDLRKYLAIFGSVTAVLVVVTVVALEMPPRIKTTKSANGQREMAQVVDPVITNKPVGQQMAASGPSVVLAALPALPPNATAVPDEHLLRLAGMVNLANARNAPPDKKQWQAAIPLAQKLMDGPCDCGQKNWLTHYVEMGEFALTDSRHQYQASAELMATLARNDQQEIQGRKQRR